MNDRTESILQIIRDLPSRTITTTQRNRDGRPARAFRGALLADYARAAGLRPRAPSIGFGNHYFVVTAADGFAVALAYFEVQPRATDKRVILAYEQDGEPVRAGVRLVVPDDDLGGRSISGVVDVRLRKVPSVRPQATRPRSELLTLGGLLERPRSLTVEDLARFKTHEVQTRPTMGHGSAPVPSRRYSGVLLWEILADAVPVVDPAANEDILRRIVVARSTDGYAAVIATGEIDPRFMGGDVLVATARRPSPHGCGRPVSTGRAV